MITESLTYAKRIQLSILPSPSKLAELLGQHFVFYSPKDIVSGDFYWIEKIGSNVFFAVADCTGHGVPGAFMSLMGIKTLQQVVVEMANTSSPALMLMELDTRISNQLKSDENDQYTREGMDITLCALDKQANKVKIASAGRPVFHVRNCAITEYKGSRVYIGKNYVPDEVVKEFEIQLQPNDMIYLFTDGITDQFDRNNQKKFSIARLKELIPEIFHVDTESQCELVKNEFERWKGYTPQTDDVLIMGYRFS